MGMSVTGGGDVKTEINVTPMIDVMLVLLIIFMVAAPLLTVGVPIDLPQTQAKGMDQDKEPLVLSVNDQVVTSLDQVSKALDAVPAGRNARLVVSSRGQERAVWVRKG